jgi:hypothetical protein
MAQAASIVAQAVVNLLTATNAGLSGALGQISVNTGSALAPILPENIVLQNTPAGLAEKHLTAKYPAVHVYVDRVQNLLIEKFRTFSGRVRTVAEIRASQDRIQGLEEQLRLYVDGMTQILDANRGSWGQGLFYTGLYEVRFEAVQQGGRNFLQTAKVVFEVDLSS